MSLDIDLVWVILIALGYNLAVIVVKRRIREHDGRSHPFLLQPHDFRLVRKARDQAASSAEIKALNQLLCLMYTLVISAPIVITIWMVLSRCSR